MIANNTPVLPTAIATLLDRAAAKYGVAAALARAIAWVESGGNPSLTSPVGAMGVMQLMPNTAKALGVSDAFDPVQNVDAGVRYFAALLKQFGDIDKALAAYNWGPGKVSSGEPIPRVTTQYIANVKRRWAVEQTIRGPGYPPTMAARREWGSVPATWKPILIGGMLAGALALAFSRVNR